MAKLDPPFDATRWATRSAQPTTEPSTEAVLSMFWEGQPPKAAQAPPPVQPPPVAPSPTRPLQLPPGNAGTLAQWLLNVALLPIPEVATVTTLGLLAGIAGRAWTTPTPCTGLNIYLGLVARSATGKEMLHEGAGRVLVAVRRKVPAVVELVNFDEYASGPALAKRCAGQPSSFANFTSELGRRLKRMANPKDAPMADLRTTLLKLYSKSGPTSFVGDLVYSNARHSVPGAVACSLIGETTPGTLRAAMTQDMMEDGFLSRFGWVEYTGDRPAENPHVAAHAELPAELVDLLANIALSALAMLQNGTTCEVQRGADAAGRLEAFKRRCDAAIRAAGDNESQRQIWSRANLKAIKYASLLAVADNHIQPSITDAHAEWAIALVERDAAMFERSLAAGDVGSDVVAQEKKLLHVVREYLTKPLSPSYGFPQQMRLDGVVPRKYLQQRTSDTAAFKSHPLGATAALDHALRSVCDSGYMVEIPKEKAGELYTFQGRCFRVVSLPNV